jgi:DNA mismatch endonuclease (patch repair protein)
LPGKPDIVLPRYQAVILAHGCFWHGHVCHLFKWPSTRPEFWRAKIARNREVDTRNKSTLAAAGWRQAVVWECALRGRTRLPQETIIEQCADWLRSDQPELEIKGG